jgi:hypothetical protein
LCALGWKKAPHVAFLEFRKVCASVAGQTQEVFDERSIVSEDRARAEILSQLGGPGSIQAEQLVE